MAYPMKVKVSLPSYREMSIDVNGKGTAKNLRKLVSVKMGLRPEAIRLLVNGEYIPDGARLSKLIRNGSSVTLDYLWGRQLILWGQEAQKKIESGSVLLAGAGATGNEAAKNLAMLGVGRLLIVDNDKVELSNVSRAPFFEASDVGRGKAEVLARKLQSRFPTLETGAFTGSLEELPLKFYLDSNVVVCCLDNVISRIYLTQMCRRYSIPMVDGGIMGGTGRLQVYLPPDGACPLCIFPQDQYSHLTRLRNPCAPTPEDTAVPSLSTSASLISALMAQETVKVIQGLDEYRSKGRWPERTGPPLKSVLFVDLINNRFTQLDLKRNANCLVCGKQGTATEIVPYVKLPYNKVNGSWKKLERSIQVSKAPAPNNIIKILSETRSGSKILRKRLNMASKVRRGDYLRVLAEGSAGRIQESVIKLV